MRATASLFTAAAVGLSGLLLTAAPAGADPITIPVVGDGAALRSTTATHGSRVAAVASTLGQPSATPVNCSGSTSAGSELATEGATGPTYTAAANGVLTSFTHVANATPGSARAVVFADTAAPATKDVVAKSPFQTLTVSTTNTFAIRVPIKSGQHLGLVVNANNMACGATGVAGDVLGVTGPFDADTQASMTFTNQVAGYRPNIFAVVEPDVDNDGYGDVSQDLCPESASAQAACPAPDTTITKAPKAKSTKRKAKIKFTSTVAGSSFTCARDGKLAAPCTSPYKKKYKYGKHTVVITATSAAGIVDATPAVVTFKIKKPKP